MQELSQKTDWNKYDVKNSCMKILLFLLNMETKEEENLMINGLLMDNVPITRSPKDVVLVVAGGAGRHTMIAHGFGTSSESVTKPILFKNGAPVHSILEYKNRK